MIGPGVLDQYYKLLGELNKITTEIKDLQEDTETPAVRSAIQRLEKDAEDTAYKMDVLFVTMSTQEQKQVQADYGGKGKGK